MTDLSTAPSQEDVTAAAILDPMTRSAAAYVIRTGKVSVKGIREACMVGPFRAGEIIASLEALGVVGPADRTEKRKVLMFELPPALDPKAAKPRMKETPEDVAVRENVENAAGEELRQYRITITIPGKPFGKQRPKFDPRSGRAYTPDATVSFEQTVRELAAQKIRAPLDGPIIMTLEAVFVPAKSWSKKRRAAALGQLHTQKPDLDNIEKAILDGLNRIAFADDQQVADVRKRKRWGERAETIVTLEEAQ